MSLSNSLGLLGRKVGMMRLFTDDGDSVPVTVLDVSNNRVSQQPEGDAQTHCFLQNFHRGHFNRQPRFCVKDC